MTSLSFLPANVSQDRQGVRASESMRCCGHATPHVKLLVCALLVNLLGGLLAGYSIGFVGVYTEFYTISHDCTQYLTPDACSHAIQCVWVSLEGKPSCRFPDWQNITCEHFNETDCRNKEDSCFFDQDSETCKHNAGWDSTQLGVFAGASTVGGLATFSLGSLVEWIGRRRSLMIVGILGLVSAGIMALGTGIHSYVLLIVSRVVAGLSMGGSFVVCPMYAEEVVPERYRRRLGPTYQLCLTFGIFWASLWGLFLRPRDFSTDVAIQSRFQTFNGWQFIFSLALIPIAVCVPESPRWVQAQSTEKAPLNAAVQVHDSPDDGAPASTSSVVRGVIVACALAVAFEFTGIDAVMNYTPIIAKGIGVDPMWGNLAVMLWNNVTVWMSIIAAKWLTRRQLYLTGTFAASVACLIAGIPLFPGLVACDTLRNVCVGAGVLFYIAFFEVGMAPYFFPLALHSFPPSVRSKGVSFANFVQFLTDLIVSLLFPIATTSLSGGPSGNQHKGMAIVFVFFATCGFLSWVVMFRYMHPVRRAGPQGPSR